ncbi:hypothetical protein San01_22760 [Streptomyces angustmyceticus]|uniref:Uncharacterized protein n=1 Tax=Streptomyces angustmyceticus TaxID=285578 RepID=A0A5J4LDS3_9ACTN|nr:hypothetical protein San01_22760 [Streptomyces angustmyceticus]
MGGAVSTGACRRLTLRQRQEWLGQTGRFPRCAAARRSNAGSVRKGIVLTEPVRVRPEVFAGLRRRFPVRLPERGGTGPGCRVGDMSILAKGS